MDIAAYLRAIGLDHALVKQADVNALRLIYSRHVRVVPFNSLPIYYGTPIDTAFDLIGLADKLVTKRVGGVCIEHTLLFNHVLEQLGFNTVVLGGEVWNGVGWTPSNSHASILVTFPAPPTTNNCSENSDSGSNNVGRQQQYLCDMGYSMRSCEPLLVADGELQAQQDGRCFRLRAAPEAAAPPPADSGRTSSSDSSAAAEPGAAADLAGSSGPWVLELLVEGSWRLQHRFHPQQPRTAADFREPAGWVCSSASPFTRGWLVGCCRAQDAACMTLAAGPFAGSHVPADKAKYVVRRRRDQRDLPRDCQSSSGCGDSDKDTDGGCAKGGSSNGDCISASGSGGGGGYRGGSSGDGASSSC
ncbi:hypothetical protein Agub_g5832 [Astrephomene gubernaculifera]|uniref:Arylamine N-acetyltransferase n=1 Tax=Astrephomene gubernaculifera TaxID=47775 RepID=A0AAD3DMF8_9CHLO|nr:hypothetical protein Agub_g5832 [Astrephomene gubernaculifera]